MYNVTMCVYIYIYIYMFPTTLPLCRCAPYGDYPEIPPTFPGTTKYLIYIYIYVHV